MHSVILETVELWRTTWQSSYLYITSKYAKCI